MSKTTSNATALFTAKHQMQDKPLNAIECETFPIKVPVHFLQRIDLNNPEDPLLKQVLPVADEQVIHPNFSEDPVADLKNNPTPSLIHKYQGRALLIASPKCDIHCRYCFRRHFPYSEQSNLRHWQTAIDTIANDHSINEVILSGGDPMSLGEAALLNLIEKISAIAHVKTLRIHSRTPVVAPDKAPQKQFITWAENSPLNVVLVVHCNHANELSEQTKQLFQQYRQANIHLLNQSVLLKDINDNADILAQLSSTLFEQGVLPYYLNQLDRVQGSAHFEVDDETAIKLHQELLSMLPGYLVPKLVKDIPGKKHKSELKNLNG